MYLLPGALNAGVSQQQFFNFEFFIGENPAGTQSNSETPMYKELSILVPLCNNAGVGRYLLPGALNVGVSQQQIFNFEFFLAKTPPGHKL